jgi:hypothetical protein
MKTWVRFHVGAEDVWSGIRNPNTDATDRRQLHRDRWALSSESNKHSNRFKGLFISRRIQDIVRNVGLSRRQIDYALQVQPMS